MTANLSRRQYIKQSLYTLGAGALGISPGSQALGTNMGTNKGANMGIMPAPHIKARAKRVIYLFQSGGPSHVDLFDHKPLMAKYHGKQLPSSVIGDQRLTGMTAQQSSIPVAASPFSFSQHGESGTWVSELLPYTASIVDDISVVKSMHTEAINHDPAITFLQTGHQLAGRPSIGAWLDYGLGTDNHNLPSFIVLTSKGGGQPLYARLWGNGFLPSKHQGVQFRAGKDPVLYLNDPNGLSSSLRKQMLDTMAELENTQFEQQGDPDILDRIEQYQMAYRMQHSVPTVMDTAKEPDWVYKLYGEDARKPGTYAANCLLARRLAENNVKFIQIYQRGWDQHEGLKNGLAGQCRVTDQASAALVTDLKQRGLLEDTLVIWGGEFGRTSYSQGKLTGDFGRDHHGRCFTMWMAGGGIKAGFNYGETDDFSYNVVDKPVHVHDFHATLLHLLGIDHERLTYKYQGRRFRLTDVHGHIVKDLLS